MIDYIIGSDEVWDRIREIKVGYRIDSDRQSIEAVVKGKEKWCRKNRVSNKIRREVWDDEGRKRFREGLGGMEGEANTIEEEWKNMEDRIKEVMMRIEEERGREEKDER